MISKRNNLILLLIAPLVIYSCSLEEEANEGCEKAFESYSNAFNQKDYEKALTYIPAQIPRESILKTLKSSEKLIGEMRIENYKSLEYGKLLTKKDSMFKKIKCQYQTSVKIKEYPSEGAIDRLEESYGKGNVQFDSAKMEYSFTTIREIIFIKRGTGHWVFIEYNPENPSEILNRIIPKAILSNL